MIECCTEKQWNIALEDFADMRQRAQQKHVVCGEVEFRAK